MNEPDHDGTANGRGTPGNTERLLDLLELQLAREATTAESAEIEQVLLASDAARTMAVRFLTMQALLERFESESPADIVVQDRLPEPPVSAPRSLQSTAFGPVAFQPDVSAAPKSAAPKGAIDEAAPDSAPGAASPRASILGFLSALSGNLPGGDTTVGALIMLAIVGAFWGLARLTSRSGEPGQAPVAMRASQDVRWPARCRKNGMTSVRTAEPLELEAGVVELQLRQGATLLVEGPARWSIDGDNAATLLAGRLVARVPPGAIGFALATPTARIVDLGTEFGVAVDGDRLSEVVVLKGIVRVEPQPRADQSTPRAVVVAAGESVRVHGDGPHGVEVDRVLPTAKFALSLDSRQRAAPAEIASAGSVLPNNQIVVKDSGLVEIASVNELHFRPSDDDLLQTSLDAGHPPSPAADTRGKFGGQEVGHLFNGRLYDPAWKNFPLERTEDSYSAADESGLEFYFDTRQASRGYDLLDIKTIGAGIPERQGQKYAVSVRFKGRRDFEELVLVSIESAPLEAEPGRLRYFERQVAISGRDGRRLASGVDAIRFVLFGCEGTFPESVYREIDILGVPTAAP